MEKGSSKILELIDFKKICEDYDIIITGEGKFDKQSLDGKVINGIINYNPKKLIIIAGVNELVDSTLDIYSIVPNICSLEESMNNPESAISKLVNEIDLTK